LSWVIESTTSTQAPSTSRWSSQWRIKLLLYPDEDQFLVKLKSVEVFKQEEVVVLLRKLTRTKEDLRVLLCTFRLLSTVQSLIQSKYATIQINAIALLVNLSLEKCNKVQIIWSRLIGSSGFWAHLPLSNLHNVCERKSQSFNDSNSNLTHWHLMSQVRFLYNSISL
jgi:hypothetical protein